MPCTVASRTGQGGAARGGEWRATAGLAKTLRRSRGLPKVEARAGLARKEPDQDDQRRRTGAMPPRRGSACWEGVAAARARIHAAACLTHSRWRRRGEGGS